MRKNIFVDAMEKLCLR